MKEDKVPHITRERGLSHCFYICWTLHLQNTSPYIEWIEVTSDDLPSLFTRGHKPVRHSPTYIASLHSWQKHLTGDPRPPDWYKKNQKLSTSIRRSPPRQPRGRHLITQFIQYKQLFSSTSPNELCYLLSMVVLSSPRPHHAQYWQNSVLSYLPNETLYCSRFSIDSPS